MQHSEEQTWLSQMIFLMNAEKCISSSALVWINKWSGVGGFWSAFAVHWYNIVVFVLYFWTLDLGWLIGELIVSLVCKSGKDFSEREPCINHCSPPPPCYQRSNRSESGFQFPKPLTAFKPKILYTVIAPHQNRTFKYTTPESALCTLNHKS